MKRLILVNIAVLILFPLLVLAQENITITTYYPSPYGSYNELSTNKLLVGSPPASASANGVARFNPIDLSSACNEGEIYYDQSEHKFKYCDNSGTWREFSGSTGLAFGGMFEVGDWISSGVSQLNITTIGSYPSGRPRNCEAGNPFANNECHCPDASWTDQYMNWTMEGNPPYWDEYHYCYKAL